MRERIFQQPSVMTAQQHFSQVPSAEIPRSRFDRSHDLKTTFDAGELVPVFVDEVLPGDTFDMESTAFARLATPLKPIMDNLYLDTHFWFVPYRLLWQNWERFCGERVTPDDAQHGSIITDRNADRVALLGPRQTRSEIIVTLTTTEKRRSVRVNVRTIGGNEIDRVLQILVTIPLVPNQRIGTERKR